jgi:hypothetical protein
MLMGIFELSKEGELSLHGDFRVLYTVMMFIRILLTALSAHFSTMSTLICTRYCSVRRQFSTQQGTKEERKVIDY